MFWAVTIVACARSPVSTAGMPEYSDYPPRAFELTFDDALGPTGERKERGLTRLGSTPEWEPYFRTALNRLSQQEIQTRLRPELAKCRNSRIIWNLERSKTWAQEFRFDYLASFACQVDQADVAMALGELVFNAQKDIYSTYRKMARSKLPNANSFFGFPPGFPELVRHKGFRRYSGDMVPITKTPDDHEGPTFVHLRLFEPASSAGHRWLALCEQSPRLKREGDGFGWYYSAVVMNANCRLTTVDHSLIVCDGDVELSLLHGTHGVCRSSVIVCNGTITMPVRDFELEDGAVLYAAGDWKGRADASRFKSTILAGGKNASTVSADRPNAKYFREGVKENPFGIKFVSPADAGVELKLGEGVVYLGKLTDKSPLAEHGLKAGDWVKTLNGVTITNAADFRRQLRESLLWGTGLFEIKRGDQTFLRLVKFAEPPKK
jgi:hypothetical protein